MRGLLAGRPGGSDCGQIGAEPAEPAGQWRCKKGAGPAGRRGWRRKKRQKGRPAKFKGSFVRSEISKHAGRARELGRPVGGGENDEQTDAREEEEDASEEGEEDDDDDDEDEDGNEEKAPEKEENEAKDKRADDININVQRKRRIEQLADTPAAKRSHGQTALAGQQLELGAQLGARTQRSVAVALALLVALSVAIAAQMQMRRQRTICATSQWARQFGANQKADRWAGRMIDVVCDFVHSSRLALARLAVWRSPSACAGATLSRPPRGQVGGKFANCPPRTSWTINHRVVAQVTSGAGEDPEQTVQTESAQRAPEQTALNGAPTATRLRPLTGRPAHRPGSPAGWGGQRVLLQALLLLLLLLLLGPARLARVSCNLVGASGANLSSQLGRPDEEQSEPLGRPAERTHKYRWPFLGLISFIFVGATGNILVCMAVFREKRLQTATNYFLLSLAVADLLVCTLVMPFGIINEFYGHWPFDDWRVCNLYVTCDVLTCSSSILHMCFISVGRYLGIRNPLHARQAFVSRRAVLWRIGIAWASSALIASPITMMSIHDRSNIMPGVHDCAINNKYFLLFGSLLAFFIPMFVMVPSYVMTVRLLSQRAKFVRNNSLIATNQQQQPPPLVQPPPPSPTEATPSRQPSEPAGLLSARELAGAKFIDDNDEPARAADERPIAKHSSGRSLELTQTAHRCTCRQCGRQQQQRCRRARCRQCCRWCRQQRQEALGAHERRRSRESAQRVVATIKHAQRSPEMLPLASDSSSLTCYSLGGAEAHTAPARPLCPDDRPGARSAVAIVIAPDSAEPQAVARAHRRRPHCNHHHQRHHHHHHHHHHYHHHHQHGQPGSPNGNHHNHNHHHQHHHHQHHQHHQHQHRRQHEQQLQPQRGHERPSGDRRALACPGCLAKLARATREAREAAEAAEAARTSDSLAEVREAPAEVRGTPARVGQRNQGSRNNSNQTSTSVRSEAPARQQLAASRPAEPSALARGSAYLSSLETGEPFITRYLGSTMQVRSEQKATKVLGVVFFTFVVCWTPFFVINFTQAFVSREQLARWISNECLTTFLWLGYISSTINPVIYTVFNRNFRRAFRRLLLCRPLSQRSLTNRAQRGSELNKSFRYSQCGARPAANSTHSHTLEAPTGNGGGRTASSRTSLHPNNGGGPKVTANSVQARANRTLLSLDEEKPSSAASARAQQRQQEEERLALVAANGSPPKLELSGAPPSWPLRWAFAQQARLFRRRRAGHSSHQSVRLKLSFVD